MPVKPMSVRFSDYPGLVARMEEHASVDLESEVAGVIVGDVSDQPDALEVTILDVVAAQHTSSALAHVTFTHDSWDSVHAEVERRFPGQKIVGWYHSHPGFGIFLSSYDDFISRNFFNLPWQVALVVDPVRKERGMFVWQGDALVRVAMADGPVSVEQRDALQPKDASSAAIDLDLGDLEDTGQERADAPEPPPAPHKTRSMLPPAMLLLLLVVSALLVLSVFQTVRLSGVSADLRDLQMTSDSLRAAQETLDQRIGFTSNREDLSRVESRMAKAEDAITTLAAASASAPESTSTSTTATGTAPPSGSPYTLYTVRRGDTLSQISRQFYGDVALVPMIAAMNGLENADLLQAGARLVLLNWGVSP